MESEKINIDPSPPSIDFPQFYYQKAFIFQEHLSFKLPVKLKCTQFLIKFPTNSMNKLNFHLICENELQTSEINLWKN